MIIGNILFQQDLFNSFLRFSSLISVDISIKRIKSRSAKRISTMIVFQKEI